MLRSLDVDRLSECYAVWVLLDHAELLKSTLWPAWIDDFFFPEPHGPNRQGWRIDDSSDESVGLDHDMGMTAASAASKSSGLRHDCSWRV